MTGRTRIHMESRAAWRAWLEKHHAKEKEVWLVYYKEHTGKMTVPYNDAVEEALCFGWIDSIIKRIDDERYMRKFTPRRPDSVWSQANIGRARRMIKQGLMTEHGLTLFKSIWKKGRTVTRAEKDSTTPAIPADLEEALKKNKKAYDNFMNFAPGYRKMYILYIDDAKRSGTRARRIRRVVGFARENKKSVLL